MRNFLIILVVGSVPVLILWGLDQIDLTALQHLISGWYASLF